MYDKLSSCPSNPAFDADLLRRYDRPGPRYTSYPTAPQFSLGLRRAGAARGRPRKQRRPDPALAVDLRARAVLPEPVLLLRLQPRSSPATGRGRKPTSRASYREIAMTAAMFDRDREVVQLHFGGGTPNFLSPLQLRDVVDTLRRHFHFADRHDSDLSIELDPRSLSPADVAELATIGFNRASLGVQDFDPAVQAAVNRVQTVEETLAIIEACRRYGLRSVNVDLIYGLPKQTPEGFAQDARHGDRRASRPARRLQLRAPAAAVQAAAAHRRGRPSRARRASSRCCSWRSRSSRRPATSTSAWTTSRCRTTTSRWRRRGAACIATSWATRRTPTATSSASA